MINHPVGLVVKASASRVADLGLIPTNGLDHFIGRVIPVISEIGTPVATLPCTWCYRVSAGTGYPSVSIL